MIRIVDMRESASLSQGFSVWDTVVDKFLIVDGDQVFDGERDFRLCVKSDANSAIDAERVVGLLPEWAKIASERESN
jgi:hypothetical protein